MHQLRNFRNALIHGFLSLLVISCCFLGFQSNQYQKRLCGHVQNALHLTLVTLLERDVVFLLQAREHQDQIQVDHLEALARVHQNVSLYDAQWADVLHQQALELQERAAYISKTIVPAVKVAFAAEDLQDDEDNQEEKQIVSTDSTQEPEEQQEGQHWCEVTLFHAFCHLVSNTASLADTTTDQQQIQQHEHWRMVQEQQKQNATETWVLQILNNQTTSYTESASTLEEFVIYLQDQAAAEHATAELELQQAQELENEQTALQHNLTEMEQDIRNTAQARDIVWSKAVWDGYMVYALGMAALCLALGLVAALVGIALAYSCGTSTAAWHLHQQPDRHLLLRRCIIAWFVVGVVHDTTLLGDGSSAFYHAITSPVAAERATWIVGVAFLIGATQSILLHDFFRSDTSWERHVYIVFMDWVKFSTITILHILSAWLAASGVVPISVASILLNTTTQLILIGIYVIVLVWEPPRFPTGESTTVQTGESDESTPLQATTAKEYSKYVNDESSTVIYLEGSSEGSSAFSSYTTSAHAGWLGSWDILLLVCLLRVIWITLPCVQLCPIVSGFVLGFWLLMIVVIACRWYVLGGCYYQQDDRLPQTIVV